MLSDSYACNFLQIFHKIFLGCILSLYILQVVPKKLTNILLKAETKVWMHKLMLIWVISYFPKLVHVELPDERREAVSLEMLWKHLLGKLIWLVNDKTVPFLIPRDDIVKFRVLKWLAICKTRFKVISHPRRETYINYVVGLEQKCGYVSVCNWHLFSR